MTSAVNRFTLNEDQPGKGTRQNARRELYVIPARAMERVLVEKIRESLPIIRAPVPIPYDGTPDHDARR